VKKNFLFESNRVFVDYKRNRLYMIPQLVEVWFDMRDSQGAAITLESFITQARRAAEKQWDEQEWVRLISGVFQCSNEIPHSELTTLSCSVSFLFGMMFERLRQKRGVTIELKTRKMTSEEMDSVAKEFDEAIHGTEEEGEVDDE
jgi:hypothetical protein